MVEGADRHPQSRAFTPSCRDDNRASFVPERATLRRVRSWGSRRELFSFLLKPLSRATNTLVLATVAISDSTWRCRAACRAVERRREEEEVVLGSVETRNEALNRGSLGSFQCTANRSELKLIDTAEYDRKRCDVAGDWW